VSQSSPRARKTARKSSNRRFEFREQIRLAAAPLTHGCFPLDQDCGFSRARLGNKLGQRTM